MNRSGISDQRSEIFERLHNTRTNPLASFDDVMYNSGAIMHCLFTVIFCHISNRYKPKKFFKCISIVENNSPITVSGAFFVPVPPNQESLVFRQVNAPSDQTVPGSTWVLAWAMLSCAPETLITVVVDRVESRSPKSWTPTWCLGNWTTVALPL